MAYIDNMVILVRNERSLCVAYQELGEGTSVFGLGVQGQHQLYGIKSTG